VAIPVIGVSCRGLETVSKNPLNLSGNDELRLEVQGDKPFENKIADFWHIVFSMEGDRRFPDRGKFLEIGIVDDFPIAASSLCLPCTFDQHNLLARSCENKQQQ